MKWFSTVSTLSRADDAIREVGEASRDVTWDHGGPDVALVFASGHPDIVEDVGERLRAYTGVRHVLGCTAGGVVGGGREIEHRPAVALMLGSLPAVEVLPFHLLDEEMPGADDPPAAWYEALGVTPDPSPNFVLLPDPFSCRAEALCTGLDYAYPGATKIGGIASGVYEPGATRLWVGDGVRREGVAGFALRGEIEMDTVVAQGCRPAGPIYHVTKCQGSYLMELDGRRAYDVIREVFETLDERDQDLVQQRALFLGVLNSSLVSEPGPGDFLIRALIGFDGEDGVLQVGATMRVGQTVRFHLRDAEASARDLRDVLAGYASAERSTHPRGALMFSCLGRGEVLYGEPDHDSRMFRDALGNVPLGGFFCSGELGPVGDDTYVHGYTSAFGIFREPDPRTPKS